MDEPIKKMHLPIIGQGFTSQDQERLTHTLHRFLAHINGDVCVAGGVAMQAHLVHRNPSTKPRAFNDLDLIIHDVSQVTPTIVTDFAIWHRHPHDLDDGLYVALVDKQNGVKIDVFGWERFPPQLQPAMFDGQIIYIRSAADLLTIFLKAMSRRIRNNRPLIRKQLEDAQVLANTLHAPRTKLDAIEEYVRRNPSCFQTPAKATKAVETCTKCATNPAYPLASEAEIEALRSLRP